MSDLLMQIQLDDLDEEQKEVAELIGLENYIRLLKVYGGQSIYLPKPDSFSALLRNELIKQEFNGYNFRELSHKYGLTEVWIRNIVADKIKVIRAKPIDGQVTLFGA